MQSDLISMSLFLMRSSNTDRCYFYQYESFNTSFTDLFDENSFIHFSWTLGSVD